MTACLLTAHTNESALALSRTLKKTFPGRGVVFLIAMASEKDHAGFLNGLISGSFHTSAVLMNCRIQFRFPLQKLTQ